MEAMYYDKHKVFEKPNNVNTRIWRFMDFTKFVSLLDKSSLFFVRSDCVEDPFEGTYPLENIKNPQLMASDTKTKRQIREDRKRARRCTLINCWHMNEYESAAMWNLYLKGLNGVALSSTIKSLQDSFSPNAKYHVYIGMVKYIDYRTERIPEINSLYPFIYKRKSFEHEKELRAIILDWEREYLGKKRSSSLKNGEYVSVNIKNLVEKVYVSPNSEEWYKKLVESVIKNYGLELTVEDSSLSERPIW
jgi:hypothetical protein